MHKLHTKQCTKCKEIKDVSLFSKDRGTKDGLFRFCKPCQSIIRKNHYIKNKEHERTTNKQYIFDNKEQRDAYHKQYKKENYAKVLSNNSKRRAARVNATPQWLTEEHHIEIEWFYEAAQALSKIKGMPYEVDHIHPLKGKNFSGLHVPWNLQILTAKENAAKSNKLLAKNIALII